MHMRKSALWDHVKCIIKQHTLVIVREPSKCTLAGCHEAVHAGAGAPTPAGRHSAGVQGGPAAGTKRGGGGTGLQESPKRLKGYLGGGDMVHSDGEGSTARHDFQEYVADQSLIFLGVPGA